MAQGVHIHASVGHNCGKLCPFLDILPSTHHTTQVLQRGLWNGLDRRLNNGSIAPFGHDHHCPIWWSTGRLAKAKGDPLDHQCSQSIQLWGVRGRGPVPLGGGLHSKQVLGHCLPGHGGGKFRLCHLWFQRQPFGHCSTICFHPDGHQ